MITKLIFIGLIIIVLGISVRYFCAEKYTPFHFEKNVPINFNGTGVYDISPVDYDHASCAERAFVHCEYAFWNDIFGYGSMNSNAFDSPEMMVRALFIAEQAKNAVPAAGTKKKIITSILERYRFVPLYMSFDPKKDDNLGVWDAGPIESEEEFENVKVIMDPALGDRFLGFVYISKDKALAVNGKFVDAETYDPDLNWVELADRILMDEVRKFEDLADELEHS